MFSLDARQSTTDEQRLNTTVLSISPGYVRTLGVPLIQGRAFTTEDRAESPPVVVINDAMRRQYWRDDNPLGQRITIRDQSREIIGVIGNIRQALFAAPQALEAIVYLPLAQAPDPRWMVVVARTDPHPRTLSEPVRAAVQEVDPNATVQVQPMDEALHLLLAAIGFAVGLPGVFLVSRAVSSVFFGLIPAAPGTTVLVGLALFFVAVAASYMPARKATRLDPMLALRYE